MRKPPQDASQDIVTWRAQEGYGGNLEYFEENVVQQTETDPGTKS